MVELDAVGCPPWSLFVVESGSLNALWNFPTETDHSFHWTQSYFGDEVHQLEFTVRLLANCGPVPVPDNGGVPHPALS